MKRKVKQATTTENLLVPMGSMLPADKVAVTTQTDYCGNVIYENGTLSKILVDGGYITMNGTTPTYHYYIQDHQGNNRVVFNQNGTIEQTNHYYPFGMTFGEGIDNSDNRYKYNGKELDRMHGLDLYDYGARHYDAAIGRWGVMDPLSEKYYNVTPYAYCMNNPINGIDNDGRLVLFINGFCINPIEMGQKSYWKEFADKTMNHLNDHHAMYIDGSLGSWLSDDVSIVSSKTRIDAGYILGKIDAANILKMISDSNGNIVETIKVITHSMGGAYAKGYIRALMEYFSKQKIDPRVIEFEADFAPYGSRYFTAVKYPTYQYSHNADRVAHDYPMKGAINMDTSEDKNQGHSIKSFIDQIKTLPAGHYNVVNGRIVKM